MSEIPKGYIIVHASAWQELVQYKLRCQELSAQVEALREVMQSLINSHKNNSGYEPSLSVFWRNVDEASKVLNKTPQQHLAEIRVQAVEQFALHVSDNMDDGIDRAKLIILASERIYSIRHGEVK